MSTVYAYRWPHNIQIRIWRSLAWMSNWASAAKWTYYSHIYGFANPSSPSSSSHLQIIKKIFPWFCLFYEKPGLVGCEMIKREHLLNLCVAADKALAKFANEFISRESRIGVFAQTIKRSKEPEMSNIRSPSDIQRPPFSLCSTLERMPHIVCVNCECENDWTICFEHRPLLLARVRPVLCSHTFRNCVQQGHKRVNHEMKNLVSAENRNQARRRENRAWIVSAYSWPCLCVLAVSHTNAQIAAV